MNDPSSNTPTQANRRVKVSPLNGGKEDMEGKNELQLITVIDVRGASNAGCGPLSFLLSISATVGDLKACITQATGLEPEDQELFFCGLCLGNSLSTLGDALVLQSAMRHSPAVIQLDHRKKRSVSLSQNAGLVQHNSLPSHNQDQDMQQKQGSMLQEAGEHDLSLQGRWDMYSRISHTGAPELDTLELLYKEQHMALSQMYGASIMHQTLLSKSYQQPQSIHNGEANVTGACDSEEMVSKLEWVHSCLNTPSHGAIAAQNVHEAFGVGLGEEEAAAIVAEEAEKGGEKYNVNPNPNPRNRLVGLLDIRLALKMVAMAFLIVQEEDRRAFYFLLFCMLVFYLVQTGILNELWTLARGWYSHMRPMRDGESEREVVNTVAPVKCGVLSDVLYFIRSFFFSLFPPWEPVPANQPHVQ